MVGVRIILGFGSMLELVVEIDGICFIDANWKEILYRPIMGLVRNYELISATNKNFTHCKILLTRLKWTMSKRFDRPKFLF